MRSLLDLEEQRVVPCSHPRPHAADSADTAYADHFHREINRLEPVKQNPVMLGQGFAVGLDRFQHQRLVVGLLLPWP
jgi:hypothetical protein